MKQARMFAVLLAVASLAKRMAQRRNQIADR